MNWKLIPFTLTLALLAACSSQPTVEDQTEGNNVAEDEQPDIEDIRRELVEMGQVDQTTRQEWKSAEGEETPGREHAGDG